MHRTRNRGYGLKRVKHRYHDALAAMDWVQFETMLADHYRSLGWQVEHCGTAGKSKSFDGGIDLKLRRADEYVLVQCKHWNVMKVTHNAVHELIGIMVNQSATGAVLISSGEFTRAALDAAGKQGHVQLIDGKALREMLAPLPAAASASTPDEHARWQRDAGYFAGEYADPALSMPASQQSENPADAMVNTLSNRARRSTSMPRKRSRQPWWIPAIGIPLSILAVFIALRNYQNKVNQMTVHSPRAPAAPALQSPEQRHATASSEQSPVVTAQMPAGHEIPGGCELIDARSGSYVCRQRPVHHVEQERTPARQADRPGNARTVRSILDNTPEM